MGRRKTRQQPVIDRYISRRWGNLHNEEGLASLTAFARAHKNAYNLKELEKSLSRIPAFSMHRRTRKNTPRPAIIINRPFYSYCADLIQLTTLKKQNSGYAWVLIVLDQFRKYVSLQPLKSKTGIETAEALKKALKEMSSGRRKGTVKHLTVDAGKEFLNTHVKELLRKEGITLHVSKTNAGAPLCERSIKFVKSLMWRYMTLHNTKRWVDIVPKIAWKVNNRVSDATGFKPKDINDSNSEQAFSNMYSRLVRQKRKPNKHKVGDTVRVSGSRTAFSKMYFPGFSKDLYRVKKVIDTWPMPSYQLETLDGKELESSYTDSELSLAPLDNGN